MASGVGKARSVPWMCVWATIVSGVLLCHTLALMLVPGTLEGLTGKISVGCRGDGDVARSWSGDLREIEFAWNRLCFGPPPTKLTMALFVKTWPIGGTPGGLERHAMTLHQVLADRGHEVHVITVDVGPDRRVGEVMDNGLHIHFVKGNVNWKYDHETAFQAFLQLNATIPFDVVHTESVALMHHRANGIPNVVATWHGIAFEVVHTDIVADLVFRKAGEVRTPERLQSMTGRLTRVSDEIRFFQEYRHHVAISDYVGDVLRTIYELPTEHVAVILNGVDDAKFTPDLARGAAFRAKHGVPPNASLVLGAAGRLVQDKGHPVLFEAFSKILETHNDVYLLVAGAGPWGDRYKELAPNALMTGALPPAELAEFYNALDIFVNPTLRSQGLDLTLLEAMQCAKPLLATRFSSITRSVIVDPSLGYTFSPNVDALVSALETVIRDGKDVLRTKGEACKEYAASLFTATKMGTAYERLFLCIKDDRYCHYPLPSDHCQPRKPLFQR